MLARNCGACTHDTQETCTCTHVLAGARFWVNPATGRWAILEGPDPERFNDPHLVPDPPECSEPGYPPGYS